MAAITRKTALAKISRAHDIVAELDDLHHRVVMIRHGAVEVPVGKRTGWHGRCRWCQKTTWLQVSHILPKGRVPSLRWDSENAFALCAGCHLYRWHKNPVESAAFAQKELGPRLEALKSRAQNPKKRDPELSRLTLQLELRALEKKR